MRGSSRKQLLLRGVAWFSCDSLVFARVASSCNDGTLACRDLVQMKAAQFSMPKARNGEKLCVLPNGLVHGPVTDINNPRVVFCNYRFGSYSTSAHSTGPRLYQPLRGPELRFVFDHWEGRFQQDHWYFKAPGRAVHAKRCRYCRVFHSFVCIGNLRWYKWKRFCGERELRVWMFDGQLRLSRRDSIRKAVVKYATWWRKMNMP